jgi:hypothetical protein
VTASQAQRRKVLARWHRLIALVVSLWLVALAASGILINHANDWGLDRKPLPGSMQRWVYGIEIHGEDFCETAAFIGADCIGVFARLKLPAGALLLSENSLFLLDDSGALLEKLSAGQLGLGGLQAAYREGSHVYLRDAQSIVLTDADLLAREVLDPEASGELDNRDWKTRDGASSTVTWERLILDFHAARFLGPLAKLLNDLLAGLILLLAASGLYLYRLKRNGNGNGNGNQAGQATTPRTRD